jgi:hypothetical protein
VAQWRPWRRLRVVIRPIRSHHDNLNDIYYHYLINDYDPRDNDGAGNDNHSGVNNYNGGRKGYYNPAANYDHLYNSGSTASPATTASAANNDRACDNCCGDHDNCC